MLKLFTTFKFTLFFFTMMMLSFYSSSVYAQTTTDSLYAGNPEGPKTAVLFWNPGYDKAQKLWPTIKQIAEIIDKTEDARLIIHGEGNTHEQNFLMYSLMYFYNEQDCGKEKAWKYLDDLTLAGDKALTNSEKWVETWAENNGLQEYRLITEIGNASITMRGELNVIKSAYKIKDKKEDSPAIIINNVKKLTKEEITLDAVLKALEETTPNNRLPQKLM